ncbi:MAG TPA: hypothetical protein VL092_08170 [Chitinophagaceae bacterium]|nr:hypothetical protein [Chitinophagaceae bacterium]
MKTRLLILLLLVCKIGYSQNQKLQDYKVDNINRVIGLFKQKNIDKISSIIAFPLNREYPIPGIKNEKEFKSRFNEVFDKILLDKIANSKTEQWSEVGWRGIMLDNGLVWIDSYEGRITAINNESAFEKELRKNLIIKDKENLHALLKTFESPVYKIKTKQFLIRIDKLFDGKYRYAAWKINEKEVSKPDIILYNGELEIHGSGGNHAITFSNGHYQYEIYRNIIGEENPPDIRLTVDKDGQTILTQDGTLVGK